MLGSLSGCAPGVPLESLVVPIVPDAWTNYTLVAPNQPPLADTFGILDALGGSAARLDLTPGLPAALSGLTAYHATLGIDSVTLAVERVSSASEIALLP